MQMLKNCNFYKHSCSLNENYVYNATNVANESDTQFRSDPVSQSHKHTIKDCSLQ